jgi:hypothetical protein
MFSHLFSLLLRPVSIIGVTGAFLAIIVSAIWKIL